jgi:hypothetical protein
MTNVMVSLSNHSSLWKREVRRDFTNNLLTLKFAAESGPRMSENAASALHVRKLMMDVIAPI